MLFCTHLLSILSIYIISIYIFLLLFATMVVCCTSHLTWPSFTLPYTNGPCALQPFTLRNIRRVSALCSHLIYTIFTVAILYMFLVTLTLWNMKQLFALYSHFIYIIFATVCYIFLFGICGDCCLLHLSLLCHPLLFELYRLLLFEVQECCRLTLSLLILPHLALWLS